MRKLTFHCMALACFYAFLNSLHAQETLSGPDKFKLLTADESFQKEYYSEALKLYMEIYTNAPTNALINYKVGVASFLTNQPTEAYTYLSNAYKIDSNADKEILYWLGRAEHKNGLLDEALVSFQKFVKTLKPNVAKRLLSTSIFPRLKMPKAPGQPG